METVLPYLLEIVACLVVTLIGVGGTWLAIKVGKNKQLGSIQTAVEQVTYTAGQTVRELQQTLVDAWKKAGDGKLSEDQIHELKKKLQDKTTEQLSAPVIALLEGVQVDVSALIQSAGEATINYLKTGKQE